MEREANARIISGTNILVVEDDADINSLICEALLSAGYRPHSAFSGSEALLLLGSAPWQCVILDLMLPGKSGEEALDEIRKRDRMPVIVLSAKSDKSSKLELLSRGADDFMAKPFDVDELLARVAAQLRRFTEYANGGEAECSETLQYQNIVMDREAHEVLVKDSPVRLTNREYDILELFLTHPQKVFSRANIFESVWRETFLGDENTVNVHVSNLRSKLNAASGKKYIKTIWGVGFRLAE